MSRLTDACRDQSIALLRRASHTEGFLASPSFDHYASVWARDAAVASLGALACEEPDLVDTVRRTLLTLAHHQGPLGQIPDAYWPERGHWDWGEAGTVDASAWFVIAAGEYHAATGDEKTAQSLMTSVHAAMNWLRHLDTTNTLLIDSPFAGDWMDSSLSHSGRVLSVNLVYYWAALQHQQLCEVTGGPTLIDPAEVLDRINLLFWPEPGANLGDLFGHVAYPRGHAGYAHAASVGGFEAAATPDRRHYVSHVIHGGFVDRCDVFANALAVLIGAAGDRRATSIIDHLAEEGVADPYPSRTWPSPVTPQDDPWRMWNEGMEKVIPPRWRNPPWEYHNAAVWPYVGGFHVAALVAADRGEEASLMLERLAEANRAGAAVEWGFHEWLHGETGEPSGASDQTWNAGAYLLAHNAVASSSADGPATQR